MSAIKPIKTRADYDEAVVLLGELIDGSPAPGSPEDTQIRILSTLLEDYESSMLPDLEADPIEAIKLRMDQLGLKDKDLVEYFGSRSRVSEIFSGKRPLTVPMIKNLEEGLGIPASILVGSSSTKRAERWSPKTLTLMARRGYFGNENKSLEPKKILELGLLKSIFSAQRTLAPALLRQSNYRDISKVDKYHLDAWSNKVLREARLDNVENSINKFNLDELSVGKISRLFKLSSKPNGVAEIISALGELGIIVIIEPSLPSTRLDGATFFVENYVVIGLTLRYDRLDNFWFTLAHELSHTFLHGNSEYDAFYDQLFKGDSASLEDIETQADELAADILIPSALWKTSPLRYASTPTLVNRFAEKIGVHESVVAGRIRYDSKDWSVHSDIVSESKVRHLFEDIVW